MSESTVSAMVAIEAELKRLSDAGRLTPPDVVSAAESPASPLHEYFQWDDSEAARQYRLEQARDLIRTVRIEVVVCEREYRVVQYVQDPAKPSDESGYVPVMSVRSKPNAAIVMRRELARIAGNLNRAIGIAESLGKRLPGGTLERLERLYAEADDMQRLFE